MPLLFLLLIAIPMALLVFWVWMYREMLNNDYLSPSEKNFWTIAFIFFNVFAAAYYYSTEYRNRRW